MNAALARLTHAVPPPPEPRNTDEPGCPNDNYDLIEWEDQQTEALEGLWEFERKPTELADAGSTSR